MLIGNHEAYDQPYGVSPRLGQFWRNNPEGAMRANDGIPADHNLTTNEATLLYGPLYYDYRKTHNFEARHQEWFYISSHKLNTEANASFETFKDLLDQMGSVINIDLFPLLIFSKERHDHDQIDINIIATGCYGP